MSRCAGLTLRPPCGMTAIIEAIDEDKIMWGTDFGFGWSDSIEYRKGLIDRIDMPDSKRAKIMGVNAVRLFKLQI